MVTENWVEYKVETYWSLCVMCVGKHDRYQKDVESDFFLSHKKYHISCLDQSCLKKEHLDK